MDTRILDAIVKPLAERLKMLEQTVVMGNLKDIAEYKFLCGEINGLRLAQNTVEDLRKKMDDTDD